MATKSISVDVATSDTDIFEMPADMAGLVVLTVSNKDASNARTFSMKVYKQSQGTTKVHVNAKSLAASAYEKLPPISMEAGDKIILSAGTTATIVATGFANTSASNSSGVFRGFGAWSSLVTYPLNGIVTKTVSGRDVAYLSIQAGNLNKDPAAEPAWWMELLDPNDISGALIAANSLSDVASAATAFGNIKQAATETSSGVAEIATQAEAEALSDDSRFLTPLKGNQQFRSQQEYFVVAVSDEATNLSVGTGKITFRAPYAMENVTLRASVNTAPAGSTIIVDVNKNGTTMMTTNKLSIDASEKTSVTAATAVGMTTTTLADDDEITIDIDQVGSGTPGKGLKIAFYGNKV